MYIGKCSLRWKYLFAPNTKFFQERKDFVSAFFNGLDFDG